MASAPAAEERLDQLLAQLRSEGILDDQFTQLLQLQDESNPDFIDEVITLYVEDSSSKLDKLNSQLSTPSPNYVEVDQTVHQLKGSSASFGARAIAQICVQLRQACQQSNLQQCRKLVEEIRTEYVRLQGGLQAYRQLEQDTVPS